MLKSKLCSDAWKNYVADLIRSFGFFDVKNNVGITLMILRIHKLIKVSTIFYSITPIVSYASLLYLSNSLFFLQINDMASLLIQETLGKDTSGQLYTLDKDFQVLRQFYYTLVKLNSEDKPKVHWETVLNATQASDFTRVFQEKRKLSKQILYVNNIL